MSSPLTMEETERARAALESAVDAMSAARALVDKALDKLPEGAPVFWMRGAHQQVGFVRWVRMQRVGVRNARTGATYSLEAYQLTAKWGGGISASMWRDEAAG